MRALVTGAAGFLGQNLLRKLDQLGAKAIALDNLSLGRMASIGWFKGTKLRMDVRDKALLSLPGGLEVIFHFGAPCSVIQYGGDPVGSFCNTVLGFENVLKLARLKGAKLVYPSTGNVYESVVQSEDAPPKPTNLYGCGKLAMERMARLCDDVESVGLRIFAGYGPREDHKGDVASIVTLFLRDILIDRTPLVWGDGSQSRDFVYVDDVVDGIAAAARKPVPKIINLGSGKPRTFNEVVRVINECVGKDIRPRYVPKPDFYVEHTAADTTLMRKYLKISPISLEEGLARYSEEWR